MNTNERLGSLVREAESRDIKECMMECVVNGIKCSGNLITWNNKQHGAGRVFSKLDRMLVHHAWQDTFESAEVNFQC